MIHFIIWYGESTKYSSHLILSVHIHIEIWFPEKVVTFFCEKTEVN